MHKVCAPALRLPGSLTRSPEWRTWSQRVSTLQQCARRNKYAVGKNCHPCTCASGICKQACLLQVCSGCKFSCKQMFTSWLAAERSQGCRSLPRPPDSKEQHRLEKNTSDYFDLCQPCIDRQKGQHLLGCNQYSNTVCAYGHELPLLQTPACT